jgi:FdhE protein
MSSFLRKWFGGKSEPPPHVVATFDELDELVRARPSIAPACKTLHAVLEAIFVEPVVELPPKMTSQAAQAKLLGAIPLLRGVELALDEAAFHRRWQAVCVAIGKPDAHVLADAVRKHEFQPIALLVAVLAGHMGTVAHKFDGLGVDASLGGTILRLTALPVLASFADALLAMRTGVVWDHGYCPTCGSWPALAEMRGLEPTRYLRCGLCASSWEAPRFRCPFCGNSDHHNLGYFHAEGEEGKYRVATCEECRGYVKLVSTLFPLTVPQLLVKDVATLHLDLVAAQRGFMPPESA